MKQAFARSLWRVVRPFVLEYLDARALRLPDSERVAIARALKVPTEVVERVESDVRRYALHKLSGWDL